MRKLSLITLSISAILAVTGYFWDESTIASGEVGCYMLLVAIVLGICGMVGFLNSLTYGKGYVEDGDYE